MLISSTPQVFALDVLPYLNRECDVDSNDDGDDNGDGDDDEDDDDDDDDHYQSKHSQIHFVYTCSLQMRNLSSNKLF